MMGDSTTTFEVGSLAITAAGTAEQLTAGRAAQGFAITVHAHPANTGYIYIGESKADAEAQKFTLEAGASVSLKTDNIGDIWADCSVSGETVEWITEVR